MAAPIERYVDKITSEHSDKPKFSAMVAALVQPLADLSQSMAFAVTLRDVDLAHGAQLADDGEVVGVSALSGMNQEEVRSLVLGKALDNSWDGTIPGAYEIFDRLFDGTGYQMFIVDPADLTMALGIYAPVEVSSYALEMFRRGLINVRPAGVLMLGYYSQSVVGAPIFALDAPNTNATFDYDPSLSFTFTNGTLDSDIGGVVNTGVFAGFDAGAWATFEPT